LAFSGCKELSSIVFQNASNCDLGDNVFYNTKWLTNAGDYVYLGNCLYRYKGNGKTATIKNNTKKILSYAFYNCSALTSVTIPNSVTGIGKNAFYKCSSLTSVTIPNSVTNIDSLSFNRCSALTSVTLPDSKLKIGDKAFINCNSLASITIPKSVISIGANVFEGCDNLTELIYNAKNATLSASTTNTSFPISIKNFTIGNEVECIPSYFLYNNKNIASVTIPNNVINIDNYAFLGCSALSNATISKSVKEVGNSAFEGCTNLKKIFNNSSIVISKGSSANGYIAYYANVVYNNVSIDGDFRICKDSKGNSYVCDYLGPDKKITLPENVYRIADYAFYGCSDMTSVTIPLGVSFIGYKAFEGCDQLVDLKYYAQKATLSESFPTSIKNVSIGSEVIAIPALFISENKNINSILFPNSVTSIGDRAFYGCSGISSVTIPNSVTSIGDNAFAGCSGISSLTISNSVTNIGDNAFYDCSGISSVTIPNSVTSIGDNAFAGCNRLQNLEYNAKKCNSVNES